MGSGTEPWSLKCCQRDTLKSIMLIMGITRNFQFQVCENQQRLLAMLIPCLFRYAFHQCLRWLHFDTRQFFAGKFIVVELQHANHASEAPLIRKIANPSSWENLVLTSAYKRPSSVQTLGVGWGVRVCQCHLQVWVSSISIFPIPLEVTLSSKLGYIRTS